MKICIANGIPEEWIEGICTDLQEGRQTLWELILNYIVLNF
jgi:hypothetical protein